MKAKVYEDKCIGCGQCMGIIDTVFQINEDGIAEVIVEKIEEKDMEEVEMAKESCPTDAIAVMELDEEEKENA